MATSVRYRDRLLKMAKEVERESELLKSQVLGSRRRLQQTKTLIQNKENKLKQVRGYSSRSILKFFQLIRETKHVSYWKLTVFM